MTTYNAANIIGQTVHALRGTKYAGCWTVTAIEDATETGAVLRSGSYLQGFLWADLFPTEADARAAAKARRKPRTVRQPQPLYGDFAQLAALYGITTDGTGRVPARAARRSAR